MAWGACGKQGDSHLQRFFGEAAFLPSTATELGLRVLQAGVSPSPCHMPTRGQVLGPPQAPSARLGMVSLHQLGLWEEGLPGAVWLGLIPLPSWQAHERLEETRLEAVRDNNVELVQEILKDIAHLAEQNSVAAELAHILQEPHFQVQPGVGAGGGEAHSGLGRELCCFLGACVMALGVPVGPWEQEAPGSHLGRAAKLSAEWARGLAILESVWLGLGWCFLGWDPIWFALSGVWPVLCCAVLCLHGSGLFHTGDLVHGALAGIGWGSGLSR